MKKLILILLLIPCFAQAAERAIVVDREWESSPWQVVQKIGVFNHVIVMVTDSAPKEGTLEYFMLLAHWRGIKVSLCLNVSDGTDAIFYPDYPARIAATFAAYADKYKPDGMILDSVRTRYGHGLCDTDYCRNDLFRKYGISLNTVMADVAVNGWTTQYRPIMTDWNGLAVTRAVEAIRTAVKAVRNVEISVASYSHPYWEMEGALPSAWVNAGIVDHYYLMDYANEPTKHDYPKDIPSAKYTVILGAFYMFNNSGGWVDMYSRDPKHLDWLIKSIEGVGDGYAIYSYRFVY